MLNCLPLGEEVHTFCIRGWGSGHPFSVDHTMPSPLSGQKRRGVLLVEVIRLDIGLNVTAYIWAWVAGWLQHNENSRVILQLECQGRVLHGWPVWRKTSMGGLNISSRGLTLTVKSYWLMNSVVEGVGGARAICFRDWVACRHERLRMYAVGRTSDWSLRPRARKGCALDCDARPSKSHTSQGQQNNVTTSVLITIKMEIKWLICENNYVRIF